MPVKWCVFFAVLAESPCQKFRKGERLRRMWTLREEEILATSLLELVARGWKSDNGFHAGYISKNEDSLRAELPNSDLKGTPTYNIDDLGLEEELH